MFIKNLIKHFFFLSIILLTASNNTIYCMHTTQCFQTDPNSDSFESEADFLEAVEKEQYQLTRERFFQNKEEDTTQEEPLEETVIPYEKYSAQEQPLQETVTPNEQDASQKTPIKIFVDQNTEQSSANKCEITDKDSEYKEYSHAEEKQFEEYNALFSGKMLNYEINDRLYLNGHFINEEGKITKRPPKKKETTNINNSKAIKIIFTRKVKRKKIKRVLPKNTQ